MHGGRLNMHGRRLTIFTAHIIKLNMQRAGHLQRVGGLLDTHGVNQSQLFQVEVKLTK